MAFGIIHFLFLVDAIIMTICSLLLFRRYFEQRTLLTLVFSLFLFSFSIMCYAYFGRGLFEMNTEGSILLYRFSILITVLGPSLLALFVLYPIALENKGNTLGMLTKIILVIIWAITAISGFLTLIGDVAYRFTVENMDIYQITYGFLPYLGIMGVPVIIAIIDLLVFGVMIRKETETFYKNRAVLLFTGWLFTMIGQLSLLSAELMILHPILFGTGTFIMAFAILRRPS